MIAVTEIVAPATGKRESLGLFAATLVALGFGWAAIAGRQVDDNVQRLFDWQISAFHDLTDADQAIYNALLTAGDELWWIHEDLLRFGDGDITKVNWPTVNELERDYALPPFVDDVSARQNGSVIWRRATAFSFEGATVYFGNDGQNPGQSAYLLLLSHVHKGASYANGAQIWIHEDASIEMPTTVKRDSLIVNGWKEVVAYSGKIEVERLQSN